MCSADLWKFRGPFAAVGESGLSNFGQYEIESMQRCEIVGVCFPLFLDIVRATP